MVINVFLKIVKKCIVKGADEIRGSRSERKVQENSDRKRKKEEHGNRKVSKKNLSILKKIDFKKY